MNITSKSKAKSWLKDLKMSRMCSINNLNIQKLKEKLFEILDTSNDKSGSKSMLKDLTDTLMHEISDTSELNFNFTEY